MSLREERNLEQAEKAFERMIEMVKIGRKLLIILILLQGIYTICQIFHISLIQLVQMVKPVKIIKLLRENRWLQPYIDLGLWGIMLIDFVVSNRASIFEKMSPRIVLPISILGIFLSMLSMMYSITPMNITLFIIYTVSLIYMATGKASIVELHRAGAVLSPERPVHSSEAPYLADVACCEYYPKYYTASSETGRRYGIYSIGGHSNSDKYGRDVVHDGYYYSSTGNYFKTVEDWEDTVPPSEPYKYEHYYEGEHSHSIGYWVTKREKYATTHR